MPLDNESAIEETFQEYFYDDLPDDFKPSDLNDNEYIT